MNKIFYDKAWEDYLYFQKNDKKILQKINDLIKDIERNGLLIGIGKPERLKGELNGLYSRRINYEHRLVYYIEDNNLFIVGCKTHYKNN
ncbi:Txe/YoeB family addiction module toxin [Brachyspira hyodysenteriae]|uniref:Putative mRNA interferase YoeB n=1 Tax=Brachyspira hyodysenteriae ATCC 27164 TaxID=1266923 RepID=A0A3B6W2N5_BRAHO|nr:Txe/YoeB family addiction module toxin [Brachyspira hyodysenteriae]ANN62713.1 Txe/YoeB family addiction module toxin [Brachyspira hyodysenteriae ATCC 27164]KLI15758.1 Txe/YoeB family addiction module toxin [Brachyspira hyodysenteriae]KLI23125.1 Txe/YoeB family addiction module toxin [Brachyspira hyodysenteriae]KLI26438.1 Txe/YoeB family addiction module toxin [Brachyspira hyodysenteriae]KLI29095.1 Txe/YoeB family addiction module toxin [Brachyspira hyodysenteriae]